LTITSADVSNKGMDAKLFTAAVLRYFHIGPRTARYRRAKGHRNVQDLHAEIVEAVTYAVTAPGYFTENTQAALRIGWAAVNAYEKHIGGYRATPEVVSKINQMSAFQFVKLLGQMIDAGVSNNGEGERFFQTMR
jgi:hypothetical protein